MGTGRAPRINPIGADMLRSYVERIERLDEEAKALSADKSEVYHEAKGNGFDVKVMKEIIRQRRKDGSELAEFESLVDLYRHALGMAVAETGTSDATRARPHEKSAPAIRPGPNAVASSGRTGESAIHNEGGASQAADDRMEVRSNDVPNLAAGEDRTLPVALSAEGFRVDDPLLGADGLFLDEFPAFLVRLQ